MGTKQIYSDPAIGTKFTHWTILGPSKTVNKQRVIPVRCSCGHESEKLFSNIITGKSTSCGHPRRTRTLPTVGSTVGEWTVLSRLSPTHARVQCSCGAVLDRHIYSLGTMSMTCGHPVPSGYMEKWGRHGRARGNNGRERSKLLKTLRFMNERCYDTSNYGYKDYGGRGITVCEEWRNNPHSFVDWAIAQGYRVGQRLQIDRINNDEGYRPDNCRWVSAQVNSRNRRNTRHMTAFGETKALGAWMEDPRCQVKYATLWERLKRGVDPELALTLNPQAGSALPKSAATSSTTSNNSNSSPTT